MSSEKKKVNIENQQIFTVDNWDFNDRQLGQVHVKADTTDFSK